MSTGLNAMPRDGGDDIDFTLRALLAETLGLSQPRVAAFGPDTELFGALPEFDSMAVANLLTGIEERFAVLIEDDAAPRLIRLPLPA